MGSALSNVPTGRGERVTGDSVVNMPSTSEEGEVYHDTLDELEYGDDERTKVKEAEMEEFRKELQMKREQRRVILDRHKTEKKELETSLENERKAKFEAYENNRNLRELLIKNNIEIPDDLQCYKENLDITETIVSMREEFEKLRESNIKLRRDLVESNKALQEANSDIADLQEHNTESIKHIKALKEVVSVSKTMLSLREQQLLDLKTKLGEIEKSLADREANMLSTDLREEYERQLQNIRTLRALYEERARLAEVTRQGLLRELEEQKALKQAEMDKVTELSKKVDELEAKVTELDETLSNKNNQIYTCQDETRGLKSEMSAVNKLFSQVLLGYKSPQDLDKLVHRLEENHGLLTHMAENENDSEASTALPKLLLEIVTQVDEGEGSQDKVNPEETTDSEIPECSDIQISNSTSAEEIVQNLPKVWRVLMELLSHQTTSDDNAAEKVTTCYKTVETKTGPVQVPSVSQTYIRLKDLIVEKLSLVKEVNRMKQLNVHLETRLEEQERRLCLVTNELSKTWHVVGRLRRHHHQLHTHEKILKYELQQKRKLLNELKEELEYCREKWEQARQKNTQSEKDWRKLRAEFSSRKNKSSASINNSAESGYSDERPSDESSESNDEGEYVTEPLIRSRKKFKKSIETILDSSTDFNLAAEREDPVSDMLDVAELPLDTQEGEDRNISDSFNTESLSKNDIVYEETEDEAGDITHDSCNEDSIVDAGPSGESNITSTSKLPQTNVPLISASEILKNVREQSERLAIKDKKLERLEKTSVVLLQKIQTTTKLSQQIDSTLDHLLNRPTSSRQYYDTANSTLNTENISIDIILEEGVTQIQSETETQPCEPPHSLLSDNNNASIPELEGLCVGKEENSNVDTTGMADAEEIKYEQTDQEANSPQNADKPFEVVDFKAIIENATNQEARLSKKDERFKTLESDCNEVVSKLSCTLKNSQDIDNKLNSLLSHSVTTGTDDKNESPTVNFDCDPSTSSEVDHEARFAARDERLKRLEEQTKSLVNKVNKTTTKGVKIHYKLEELHNIYGSENSRAGTPTDYEEKSSEEKSGEGDNDNKESHEE